ncbi:ABC transporter substrate-binding protein [Cohnella fermenti]|uniref:Extracellular solute-binding protein n=1 Tax=Cohnella fermenti TaxID=2565925 RepID=A0A4S4BJ95_9BACL|nr:extracellular solute-binding protein [Cohnella fermenti]THF74502.1 extracellular solute-binding protein [Cohnella fermenti]
MKSKWMLGTSLLLTTSVVLAACGGNNANDSASPGASASSEGSPAAVDSGSGEKVKLTMYSWRPEDADGYAAIIAEFNKTNPNIEVEFKPFKSTEYNTILNNTLQSGTGVDILQLRPYDAAIALADADYLTPVDGLAGLDQIPDSYLDAARGSDGNVYGVPFMLSNAVIFYNKNLFEENGIAVPETYEEFLAVCEQLKAKGITPIAQSGKAGYLLSMTHAVVGNSAYGGNEFAEEVISGKTDFTDSRFVDSIQRMKDLEEYFPKDFIAIEDKDAQAMFYTHEAAMYINGSHRLETFEANEIDFDVDFIPGFAPSKGEPANIVAWVDGSYAVAKSSKHQEEALKFLEFVASKSFGQTFSEQLTRVSPIAGVEPSNALLQSMAKLNETQATPYLILASFNQGAPTSKTTFEDSLQGMYLGKLTPQQVAEDFQASVAKWFKPQS